MIEDKKELINHLKIKLAKLNPISIEKRKIELLTVFNELEKKYKTMFDN
ncbi:MAG: hypothetical protein ACK5L6_01040 [Anaerorhabdus sp.]